MNGRRLLQVVAAVTCLSTLLTVSVCLIWGRLPWRQYCASCELMHIVISDGVVYQTFDNGCQNVATYERLVRMRQKWFNAGSRTGVVGRISRGVDVGACQRCLEDSEIDVKQQKSCVVVRTRSFSSDVAVACGNALAGLIIDSFAHDEAQRRFQIVKQLRESLEKQRGVVVRLVADLRCLENGPASVGKKNALLKTLAIERKMLNDMQTSTECQSDGRKWGELLKCVKVADDGVVVVPPNIPNVFLWSLCCTSLFVIAGSALCKHKW